MTLDELYQSKGKLTTDIEVAQAKLQSVNRNIVDILNQSNSKSVESMKTK
mgnify:CR=1 FL=1